MKPSPASPPDHPRLRKFAALTLGLLLGVFFHYLLYRLSLPSNPFIYVSF
jgi:hypothetical protein